MTENIKISVVMPVYNVEKHLKKAVQSVLDQSFKNFEIILVDDCSPDKSGEICDGLASEHPEIITVLHLEENGGLSNARNKGFELVKGDYVFFMDSDDTVAADLFERVISGLEKNPADVTVFGICEEYYDSKDELSYTKDITFGSNELISDINELRKTVIELEKKTLYGYAWNKIYKTDILRDSSIIFENITLIEDITFNVKLFYHIKSLNILDAAPYNYKKRIDGSLTNKFVKDYFELHKTRVEIIYKQYETWGLCGDEVKTALANIYSRYIFSALQRNFDRRSEMSGADRKRWIKELFEDELFKKLSPYMTSDNRIVSVLNSLLKSENAAACLFTGGFIYTVKEKLPIVFAKAKQNR